MVSTQTTFLTLLSHLHWTVYQLTVLVTLLCAYGLIFPSKELKDLLYDVGYPSASPQVLANALKVLDSSNDGKIGFEGQRRE